jgi:hypothetical protein
MKEKSYPVTVRCAQCGLEFTARADRHRKFCSYACFGLSIRGEKHYRYQGGHINYHGYQVIQIDAAPVLLHRHLMEEHLGRRLLPREEVHHINEDRLDNRLENLMLLASESEHQMEHCGFRSDTAKQCVQCGIIKPRTEFYPRHVAGRDPNVPRCKPCHRKHQNEARARRIELQTYLLMST